MNTLKSKSKALQKGMEPRNAYRIGGARSHVKTESAGNASPTQSVANANAEEWTQTLHVAKGKTHTQQHWIIYTSFAHTI